MDHLPPSLEFTHERTVDDSHIDVNGHVNNVVFEFRRGDTLLARGETDWVFVDITTGRPKSIPPGFTDLFRPESDASAPAC